MGRCRRRSSTLGQVLTAFVESMECSRGALSRGLENRGLGFGICMALGFGLEMHCFEWVLGLGVVG